MATVAPIQVWRTKRASKTSWLALANGDTGFPDSSGRLSDKSVQVTGTFGAGGSVTIQGSNDGGTTWFTLNDPSAGTDLTFTTAGGFEILENVELIRPNVTAGDGTTALNVYLFCASTA